MISSTQNRAAALGIGLWACISTAEETPFAWSVVDYAPAPGQYVNDPSFNDPTRALGAPHGGGTFVADNSSVVSLGGFGGSITLAFDHTVTDDASNPLGLDAIVFGNAFWVGQPNRRWAECAVIEICRDANGNGYPDEDEPWYLIPGSHVTDLDSQFESQIWDDDFADPVYPPENPTWMPVGRTGVWQTFGYRLPSILFDAYVLENPLGTSAEIEGVYGYADLSPTLILGDLDGDNVVDDAALVAEAFYTFPDDPLSVGVTLRSGGGDAFDIAWARNVDDGSPASLDGFDFIRVTTGANRIGGALGEVSSEIDAVADVAAGLMGDADADQDLDLSDFAVFVACGVESSQQSLRVECRVMDFDDDGDVDRHDFATFQTRFTGNLSTTTDR